MSTRYNNGSHYENHQRAAELHDLGAHAHRAAVSHGSEDHLTAHEHSRQEMEHAEVVHAQAQTIHGIPQFGHAEIAALAHQLWEKRGCPEGSPDEDWMEAVKELRSLAEGH